MRDILRKLRALRAGSYHPSLNTLTVHLRPAAVALAVFGTVALAVFVLGTPATAAQSDATLTNQPVNNVGLLTNESPHALADQKKEAPREMLTGLEMRTGQQELGAMARILAASFNRAPAWGVNVELAFLDDVVLVQLVPQPIVAMIPIGVLEAEPATATLLTAWILPDNFNRTADGRAPSTAAFTKGLAAEHFILTDSGHHRFRDVTSPSPATALAHKAAVPNNTFTHAVIWC